MSIFRVVVILAVVGLIVGGASYFAYDLYWKPKMLDKADREAQANAPAPTPPPDPSVAVFEKAAVDAKTGDPVAIWTTFIQNYPTSPKITEARAALGEVNVGRVFSPGESPEKIAYTVVSGDALAKIASKFKTNADLIFRVNNLETINLKIGQQLFIPQLEPSLVVDRQAHTVTLLNKGQFFKEYPALAVKVPGAKGTPIETKVGDKVAIAGSNRVAFGTKEYAGAERWLMLGGGVTIRSVPEGTEHPPAGIILSPADMDELFLLTSRGAPVTIN